MALTSEQLAQLRKMIDEITDADGWTDEEMELLAAQNANADGSYNLKAAAAAGWSAKAAKYVELVQMSESGSSRALNQMFDHAVAMAKLYDSGAGTGTDPAASAPRSTRIVRATRGA